MTACRATLSLEGMLRTAAPAAAPPVKTPAAEPAPPARWRIVTADGSRDACPSPTPAPSNRAAADDAGRPNPDVYARLAAGLEMMAAAGVSLPERGKARLAMPSATPDVDEILAAASVVAPPPPERAAQAAGDAQSNARDCSGCGPSGACHCRGGNLDVAPVVEAWPRLPRDIRAAILALASASLR